MTPSAERVLEAIRRVERAGGVPSERVLMRRCRPMAKVGFDSAVRELVAAGRIALRRPDEWWLR